MGTTADKLAYLEGTKAAIREAIAARGVDVPEGTTFRDYAGKIGEISGGGGGKEQPFEPEAFYKEKRPAEWLPLPEPADDEIYFLLGIMEDLPCLLAFTAQCTGSYTVEYGTTEGGAFVPAASVTLASGEAYESEFSMADSRGLTGDSLGQLVFRVRGQGISSWNPSPHSRAPKHSNWSILEFSCRLPSCTSLKLGNFESQYALPWLRFFAWFGGNAMEDMSDMFYGCHNLMAIRALDTSSVTNMLGAFRDCALLEALPQLETSKVTTMEETFTSCSSLQYIPAMDTGAVENFRYTFESCFALKALPWLNTQSVIDMENAFACCRSLKSLPPLSMAGPPGEWSLGNSFYSCCGLQKLVFTDTGSWPGSLVDISDSALDHDAVVALINSLPSVSTTRELRIYDVPGSLELTEAEKQVATDKGWQVKY